MLECALLFHSLSLHLSPSPARVTGYRENDVFRSSMPLCIFIYLSTWSSKLSCHCHLVSVVFRLFYVHYLWKTERASKKERDRARIAIRKMCRSVGTQHVLDKYLGVCESTVDRMDSRRMISGETSSFTFAIFIAAIMSGMGDKVRNRSR